MSALSDSQSSNATDSFFGDPLPEGVGRDGDDSGVSTSDDMFSAAANPLSMKNHKLSDDALANSGLKELSGSGLFVPGFGASILDDERPSMPGHREDELPPGTQVWLVDAEDIAMLLKAEFDTAMLPHCHGKSTGEVIRHSGNVTLVKFSTLDFIECFSLPRAGLSKVPIPPKSTKFKITDLGGLGVGDLGPKAGMRNAPNLQSKGGLQRLSPHDHFVFQLTISEDNTAAAAERTRHQALQLYRSRHFSDVEQLVTKADISVGTETLTEQDRRLWRSQALLKAQQVDEALTEALACIENDPDWIPGYVQSAQVYASIGKLGTAGQLLHQAAFLPRDRQASLTPVIECNETLEKMEERVCKHGLGISVDPDFRRRLTAKRRFPAGSVIFTEKPSCAIPALANEARLCANCFDAIVPEGVQLPTGKIDESLSYCCSNQCAKEAKALHRDYEAGDGARSTFAALFVIRDRLSSVANTRVLDHGLIAMRAFHVLISNVRRRTGSKRPPATCLPEMRALGLLPTPLLVLESKTKSDIQTLYNLLATGLTPEEQQFYTHSLFMDVFLGVMAYSALETYDAKGKEAKLNIVLPVLSCATSGFTTIARQTGGSWSMIATKDIEAGERV